MRLLFQRNFVSAFIFSECVRPFSPALRCTRHRKNPVIFNYKLSSDHMLMGQEEDKKIGSPAMCFYFLLLPPTESLCSSSFVCPNQPSEDIQEQGSPVKSSVLFWNETTLITCIIMSWTGYHGNKAHPKLWWWRFKNNLIVQIIICMWTSNLK